MITPTAKKIKNNVSGLTSFSELVDSHWINVIIPPITHAVNTTIANSPLKPILFIYYINKINIILAIYLMNLTII